MISPQIWARVPVPVYAAVRLLGLFLLLARWGASPLLREILHLPPDPIPVGVRIRKVLQALGMTFSKFGQYLATRFDLLPEAVYREMQLFFESATPFPFAEVRRQVEASLGGPMERFYRSFEETPIAAASIGQVHRAVTASGEKVAVKVRRPGIHHALMADIVALRWFGWVADALGVFGEMSASDTIAAFAESTLRETDFTQEARASAAIAVHTYKGVTVPRVHMDLTAPAVLTMAWVDGTSLLKVIDHVEARNWEGLRRVLPGLDYRVMVDQYVQETLLELFGRGLFHGDPHPGNVLIGKDGTIFLIDFGIVGSLSPDERRAFTGFFESLALGDTEMCYHHYSKLSPPSAYTDRSRYRRELTAIIHEWHLTMQHGGTTPAERHSGRFMGRVSEIMRNNAVQWEPTHQLVWRCILTLHAVQLRLAPDLDLFDSFRRSFDNLRKPPLQRVAASLLSPETWQNSRRALLAGARVASGPAKDISEGTGLAAQIEDASTAARGWRSEHARLAAGFLLLPLCLLAGAAALPAASLLLAFPLLMLALWPRPALA